MHTLPPLPYSLESLAPSIEAETLRLHHGKHHRAYVDKLNAALIDQPNYRDLPVAELLSRLDELDPPLRDAVRKHGGGHANHSLMWETLTPQRQRSSRALSRQFSEAFGSPDGLKKRIVAAAGEVFGSGWVFLTARPPRGGLQVVALPNQESPWSQGAVPLLALDLWEHAYYLQYRHERAKWTEAWWRIVDWHAVESKLDQALSRKAA